MTDFETKSSGEAAPCGRSVHSFTIGGSSPCGRAAGHEGSCSPGGFIIRETTTPVVTPSADGSEP